MVQAINSVNSNNHFTGSGNPKLSSDTRQDIQTGTTVIGGTAATAATAKRVHYMSQVNKGKEIVNMVKEPTTKIGRMFKAFGKNTKGFADDIVRWASKFENNKMAGLLLKNKGLFSAIATGIGGLTAAAVLISGLSNVVTVTTDSFQKKLSEQPDFFRFSMYEDPEEVISQHYADNADSSEGHATGERYSSVA